MLRRRYLHGSFAVATVPLSGCLGLLDSDEPTRDDLSDYDETGLRRYEEAYAKGTETHEAFVERLQSDIESLGNGQRSGNAAFAAHDAAIDLFEEFTDVHETYMEALYLSETPAFNRPSYEGASWAQAYADVCDALYVSNVSLQGLDTARVRLQNASGLASPVEPEMVLERVLEHY